jgi:deoxyuridine 5'-triphosphate nucleotidohydrolase
MQIKIKREGVGAIVPIPQKATEGAVCYDVVASSIVEGNGKAIVMLGFSTEIPKGFKGCIVPRSSLTHKGWVMANSPGQVDSDYRGEWMVKFEAIPSAYAAMYPNFPYKVGDRIAQIYFEEVQPVEFIIALEGLEETERDSGGFGSTGK